ncbi:hypothetical protein LNN35_08570 [Pseudomonas stutzeri]|uniref:Uncharacterized protein n=1 Tax=Stutzerimonas frequens TaxID=2968969 RepID=A0ABX6XY91_9GAMM|nr:MULTISPECIES: hypothetical protein [Stutzerimonas stutzeri group]MCC8342839.1 hypothetical protein [Stutzerimonas stutzeri]MCQ4302696.1 hypothetical protein [Stutzerimonas frequens]PNF52541.1 hypothetical protein C1170_06285 [Stutzerimonas frequens]QPT19022.1 hypothetical protein I6G34_06590 [Stutzerimonas frequens]
MQVSEKLRDLDLLFTFEDLAKEKGWPVERNDQDNAFADALTQRAWEAFEAAHGPHGRKEGQQLYAEIKKSSKYAHQAEWCRTQGYGYPFKVRIVFDTDGYSVKGGVGGQYRLEDVNLYVLQDGKKIRVR